jgi:hypothetical protein
MASEFLLESEVEDEKFPMNPILIQKEQEKDKSFNKTLKNMYTSTNRSMKTDISLATVSLSSF